MFRQIRSVSGKTINQKRNFSHERSYLFASHKNMKTNVPYICEAEETPPTIPPDMAFELLNELIIIHENFKANFV